MTTRGGNPEPVVFEKASFTSAQDCITRGAQGGGFSCLRSDTVAPGVACASGL